jgi:hypothetical protein
LKTLLTFVNAYARGSSAASLAQLSNFPLPGQTATYHPSDLPSTTNPYAIGFAEGKRFCDWEIAWVGATNGVGAGKTPLKRSVTEETPANMQMPTGLNGVAQGQAPNRVTSGPTNTTSKSMPTGLGGQLPQNQPGPANPPPGLATLLGDLTWLKTVNPSGCQLNCGQCAVAVAKALNGQGISNAPYSCRVRFSGATARVVGTVDSQIEQELGGKFGAYGSAGDANNAIYNAGNGAQGVVSASGATGGGHYFNIVNDNGNVRLLDGQTGAEISWSSFKPGTTFALLPVK